MRSRFFIALAVSIFAFSACSREGAGNEGKAHKITFTASFDDVTKATATAFEEGDQIGLTIGAPMNVRNAVLKPQGNSLVPEEAIYWPENMDPKTKVKFVAFYPATPLNFASFKYIDLNANEVFSITVNRDQYRSDQYEYYHTSDDYMSAVTESSPEDGSVQLHFKHLMSQFQITVVNQLSTEEFIASRQYDSFCSVEVRNVQSGGLVNFSEQYAGGEGSFIYTIYPAVTGDNVYTLILPPQTASPELVFNFTSERGMVFSAKSPITFPAGKKVSATITLKEDGVTMDYQVQDWTDDTSTLSFQQDPGAQPNNEIWYTSTDGNVITPANTGFGGANITSNTYADGKGVMVFDADVTEMSYRNFSRCNTLETLSMPNSVTVLGNQVFEYCTSLSEIKLSDNLTSMGRFVFTQCALTSITLPVSLQEIEAYNIFDECAQLESINGKFASDDHRCLVVNGMLQGFAPANLTSYTVPATITAIGEYAFDSCSKLTEIVLPSGLKSIGFNAFGYCYGLQSITIPNSIESISTGAFYACRNLAAFNGKYASEDHRCIIKDNEVLAFAISGLTEYTVPSGVETIGDLAFSYNNSSFTTIHFPSGLTTIGKEAFERLSALDNVVIPSSVTKIDDYAFAVCSGLNRMTILAATPPTAGRDILSGVEDVLIYVPSASVDAYKGADGWKTYAAKIQAIAE